MTTKQLNFLITATNQATAAFTSVNRSIATTHRSVAMFNRDSDVGVQKTRGSFAGLASAAASATASIGRGMTSIPSLVGGAINIVGDLARTFLTLGAVAGAALLGITAGFVKFGLDAAQAAGAEEAAYKRAAITFTAYGKSFPAEEIAAFSAQMQKLTGVADDQVAGFVGLLGSFNLTASQVKQLTPAILDAAEALKAQGVSAEGLAVAIGKALGTGQVASLRRMGIIVDTVRAKWDTWGAVLEAVTKQGAGAAVLFRSSLPGSMQALRNSIGDIQESIGAGLTPALTTVVGWFSKLAEQKGLIDALSVPFKALGDVIKNLAEKHLPGFGNQWTGVWESIKKLTVGAIKVVGGTIAGLVNVFIELNAAQENGLTGFRNLAEGMREWAIGAIAMVAQATIGVLGLASAWTIVEATILAVSKNWVGAFAAGLKLVALGAAAGGVAAGAAAIIGTKPQMGPPGRGQTLKPGTGLRGLDFSGIGADFSNIAKRPGMLGSFARGYQWFGGAMDQAMANPSGAAPRPPGMPAGPAGPAYRPGWDTMPGARPMGMPPIVSGPWAGGGPGLAAPVAGMVPGRGAAETWPSVMEALRRGGSANYGGDWTPPVGGLVPAAGGAAGGRGGAGSITLTINLNGIATREQLVQQITMAVMQALDRQSAQAFPGPSGH